MVITGPDVSPGSKAWLCRHYGTNSECLRRDVRALKEWLSKQPHIPPPPESIDIDTWLENMLLLVKNSIARTKTAIDLNITARSLGLQVFGNRDPLKYDMSHSFENMILTYLPGVRPDGSKVVVFKPLSGEKDREKESLDLESIIKRCVMALDLNLKEGVDFSSLQIILDIANVKFSHLAAFSPPLIRALTFCMKAYPVRVTRVNVVNISSNIERMVAFFRPFISAKIMSRVVIYKQPDKLFQVLDRETLPKDYGGEGPCLSELNRALAERLKSERDYFLSCDSWKTEENKRIGKNNASQFTSDELCNIGSFRKLAVD